MQNNESRARLLKAIKEKPAPKTQEQLERDALIAKVMATAKERNKSDEDKEKEEKEKALQAKADEELEATKELVKSNIRKRNNENKCRRENFS